MKPKPKPKVPVAPNGDDLPQHELNKRLTAARTAETDSRRITNVSREKKLRMEIAVRRDELIPKKLVQDQAAYLVIAMRAKILAIPQGWSRQLTGQDDQHEVQKRLTTLAHGLLNELRDIPRKIVDPHWVDSLEEDDL